VVEHADGRLEILAWAKLRSWSAVDRARSSIEARTEPLAA
jgi:hypothetical protein